MMEHHRGRGQTHWGWVGRVLSAIERPSIAVRSGRSVLPSDPETAPTERDRRGLGHLRGSKHMPARRTSSPNARSPRTRVVT